MPQEYDISEVEPPTSVNSIFGTKPAKLWCCGEPAILNRRLLGIISARQIDSDLGLKSAQLLKRLGSLEEVGFVGGWHSPLEEEALRILLAQAAPIVFCIPKSLNRFVLPLEIKNRVSQGQVLLLTHCSPKAKRISRDASIRRNQLVIGLATALLVLAAPPGSASLKLAKSALRLGKSVLTPEHRMNEELLASDALPATFENIRIALE
jgi:predicted Rossmann fold nucleotide-binding protein DprA/Smf involved in DNA uptake